MAKLLLTKEEAELPFANWDDASLGKAVKHAAVIFCENENEDLLENVMAMRAAATVLVSFALAVDAEDLNILVECNKPKKERGTWTISVKRDWGLSNPSEKDEIH